MPGRTHSSVADAVAIRLMMNAAMMTCTLSQRSNIEPIETSRPSVASNAPRTAAALNRVLTAWATIWKTKSQG